MLRFCLTFVFLFGAGYTTDAQSMDDNGAKAPAENEWENLTTGTKTPWLGCAIYNKSAFDYNDRSLLIGKNTNVNWINTFTDCDYGIASFGETNISVLNNVFSHTVSQLADISINKNYSKTITISNNTFNNFNIGLSLYHVGLLSLDNTLPVASVTIADNLFDGALMPGSLSDFSGSAIVVDNPLPQKTNIGISSNTINAPRIGIFARNIQDIKIGVDGPNEIHFTLGATPTATDYYSGVWLQNCEFAHVIGSGVTKTDIDNDFEVTVSTSNIRGVDIENSIGYRINCMSIDNMPHAMTFTGNCEFGLLRKNIMEHYNEAIVLFNANMTDQYQDDNGTKVPTDNEWKDAPNASTTATDRVTGTALNPINWYYQPGTPGANPFDPKDNNTTSLFLFVSPISSGTVLCNDYSSRPSRIDMLGRAVGDSLQFTENVDENTYLAIKNTYNYMNNDTSILYVDEESDEDYQDFYTAVQAINIGSFVRVRELSSVNETLVDALAENEGITEENDMEYYQKIVNDIYISKVAPVDSSLSETDSTTLESIAGMNWIEAGNAIYNAAAMLGLEIRPSLGAMRISNQLAVSQNQTLLNYTIVIMPNPVTSKLFVNGLSGVKDEIKIVDGLGNKVWSGPSTEGSFSIDVSHLSNGIYFLIVISSTGESRQRKFAVIK